MAVKPTWEPIERHGELSTHAQDDLPTSAFAFPKQRKEPLTDASHVKNALARFDQVKGVSDEDRELAFANIRKAAAHFGIEIEERRWQDLGKRPHTSNPSQ
ncbi:MAG TPA: DUF6582 domain-containing protein [Ktedonobacterales bacterium]|nr:DUF6582 domain-containing protein [Ktedonobacterales bacterium]